MNLIEHAKAEFDAMGWPGDCDMQKMVCDNILELLETLSKQGHSGSSAPYVLSIFSKLAKHDPLGPLTGSDDEWVDISEISDGTLYQNKRDGSVFKGPEGAYWLYGKIFRHKNGATFTSSDSKIPVEFPWTKPESEIVDVEE